MSRNRFWLLSLALFAVLFTGHFVSRLVSGHQVQASPSALSKDEQFIHDEESRQATMRNLRHEFKILNARASQFTKSWDADCVAYNPGWKLLTDNGDHETGCGEAPKPVTPNAQIPSPKK